MGPVYIHFDQSIRIKCKLLKSSGIKCKCPKPSSKLKGNKYSLHTVYVHMDTHGELCRSWRWPKLTLFSLVNERDHLWKPKTKSLLLTSFFVSLVTDFVIRKVNSCSSPFSLSLMNRVRRAIVAG